ncbi:MAG TPA: hypothetical protein VK982_12135 [Bacteroidales bacterium]|nr:hypothetical protein [Bacteroidales bacterium]
MERAKSLFYVNESGNLTNNPKYYVIGVIEFGGNLQFKMKENGFNTANF